MNRSASTRHRHAEEGYQNPGALRKVAWTFLAGGRKVRGLTTLPVAPWRQSQRRTRDCADGMDTRTFRPLLSQAEPAFTTSPHGAGDSGTPRRIVTLEFFDLSVAFCEFDKVNWGDGSRCPCDLPAPCWTDRLPAPPAETGALIGLTGMESGAGRLTSRVPRRSPFRKIPAEGCCRFLRRHGLCVVLPVSFCPRWLCS